MIDGSKIKDNVTHVDMDDEFQIQIYRFIKRFDHQFLMKSWEHLILVIGSQVSCIRKNVPGKLFWALPPNQVKRWLWTHRCQLIQSRCRAWDLPRLNNQVTQSRFIRKKCAKTYKVVSNWVIKMSIIVHFTRLRVLGSIIFCGYLTIFLINFFVWIIQNLFV